MTAIKSDIVKYNENTNNIKEVSKLIYDTIETSMSRVKEISETIEPVIVHMSETIENINLQLEPIRAHINEFIETYSKSIQPFIESINDIKQSFEDISLNIQQIIEKYNFEEFIVREEDINKSTELLNYINQNIDIVEDSIECNLIDKCENIILETQNIGSKKFILKNIVKSIEKEIKNCISNNTILATIIIPGLAIISSVINEQPTETKYIINNSQYVEYTVENNEYSISNDKVNIFKGNDKKSDCKYIVDKNKIDLLEIIKSQQEWSYIKFKIDDSEFEGWVISDELK